MLMVSALVFAITVNGFVTDITTGEAIEGANVKFVLVEAAGGGCGGGNGGNGGNGGGCGGGNGGNGGNGGGCSVGNVTTDINGYYEINDLEAGIYDGIARKQGSYPAVRIEDVELTEDITINFELEEGGCIPENAFESKRKNNTR